MSKAGLEMMTKVCALEYAPTGVRFNAVSACITNSNMFNQAGLKPDELKMFNSRAAKNIPL
jgi:NAD(P)-dependent dehydrogenase (short-subunit alcohol dehydrogenase family)